jgi:hypothetical protein
MTAAIIASASAKRQAGFPGPVRAILIGRGAALRRSRRQLSFIGFQFPALQN